MPDTDAKKGADAKAPEPRAANEPPKDAVLEHPVIGALAGTIKALEERTRAQGPASATPDLDRSPRGGRFLRDGVLIDAHGREINEDGSLKHPERQQVDAFGRLI
jgi:hypothetical protein